MVLCTLKRRLARAARWVMVVPLLAVGCAAGRRELPPGDAVPGDVWTRPADGMEMVLVPAGRFVMGSGPEELACALDLCAATYDDCELAWFEDETPPHHVAVDGFWMDRTEVTNGQFAAFLDERSNRREGGVLWLDEEHGQIERADGGWRPRSGCEDHPAVEVTWYAAAAYCAWAGGRLPTEAEWEYAARGQSAALFPWGDEVSGERLNTCDASCALPWADGAVDDGHAHTAPVGSYPRGASWSGVLDLAGNVYEWVGDWYAADYYARSPSDNPPGPGEGEERVLRGGAWHLGPVSARSANRLAMDPRVSHDRWGFRCVVESSCDVCVVPEDHWDADSRGWTLIGKNSRESERTLIFTDEHRCSEPKRSEPQSTQRSLIHAGHRPKRICADLR